MKVNKNEDGKRAIEINFKSLIYLLPLLGIFGIGGGSAANHYLEFDVFNMASVAKSEMREAQIIDLQKRIDKLEVQVSELTEDYIQCLSDRDDEYNITLEDEN